MDFVSPNEELITVNSNNNNNNSSNQQQSNNDSIDIASMLMHNEIRHEISVDENQVTNKTLFIDFFYKHYSTINNNSCDNLQPC